MEGQNILRMNLIYGQLKGSRNGLESSRSEQRRSKMFFLTSQMQWKSVLVIVGVRQCGIAVEAALEVLIMKRCRRVRRRSRHFWGGISQFLRLSTTFVLIKNKVSFQLLPNDPGFGTYLVSTVSTGWLKS